MSQQDRDRDHYDRGFDDAEKDARIAAFGAIRRAAEVARSHDDTYVDSVTTCMVGDCVRYAIRAAIGSEKR